MSVDDHPLTPSDVGRVELSVPAEAQYASAVRTMAAALGSDAGFSIDELDDIRLALSEVFSGLTDDAAEGAHTDTRVHLSFAIGQASIRIDVRTDDDATNIDLDELALGILRSVTDAVEITSTAVVLVKHATEAAAGSTRS